MVDVIEDLGARTVPVVFADTQWTKKWNARTFFATCNSYWAGVDTYLAGLGGSNPASHAAFKARAGFDIGLGTTAPLFGLLSSPASNVTSDDIQGCRAITMPTSTSSMIAASRTLLVIGPAT